MTGGFGVRFTVSYETEIIVFCTQMGGTCSKYGERRRICSVLFGKREGKRPLGRPRRRWEDNIKVDLQ